MTVAKWLDGFLFVDPAASCADAAAAVLPAGDEAKGSAFPCRVVSERKRVFDPVVGRRVTRDWCIGHFLMWRDGDGSPAMGRVEARAVFEAAKALGLDAIVVHGRVALIASDRIDFRQFGVRPLASIPTAA